MQSQIGIGLRRPHYEDFLEKKPDIGWVEVHSENFLFRSGLAYDILLEVRKHYPISLHGIGLSLGSADGVDQDHLNSLKGLIEDVKPFLVSDHLSWSKAKSHYLPDLLPIPYNVESLKIFSDNVDKTQNFLQRIILLENPSSYFEYTNSTFSEVEFLNTLVKKTGCQILLDVNNVYTSCLNNNLDPREYINSISSNSVKEIHLSGHSTKKLDEGEFLYIDSHDSFVAEEVWQLYELAINRFGNRSTLLEWDENIPSLDILVGEAKKAEKYFLNKQEKTHA